MLKRFLLFRSDSKSSHVCYVNWTDDDLFGIDYLSSSGGSVAKIDDNCLVYCYGSSYVFSLNNIEAVASNKFSTIDIRGLNNISNQGRFLSLSRILSAISRYFMLYNESIVSHGASIVYKGRAIIFSGVSGAGKSTQLHLWKKYVNGMPLNCDRTIISQIDGLFYASGSPWSGKEPCYQNVSYPLHSIIFINKSMNNKLIRLKPAGAYASLYQNYKLFFLDDVVLKLYTEFIVRIATKIPVYDYFCNKESDSVFFLLDGLGLNI